MRVRWRYSLRLLLIASCFLGVGLALVSYRVRSAERARRTIATLQSHAFDLDIEWSDGSTSELVGDASRKYSQQDQLEAIFGSRGVDHSTDPSETPPVSSSFWSDVFSPRNVVRLRVSIDSKPQDDWAGLRALPQLQEVEVYNPGLLGITSPSLFDDRLLEHLSFCGELRRIAIRGIPHPNITDHGVSHLGRLEHLEQLDLSGVRVSAAGIRALRHVPLKALSLSHSNLTAVDLSEIYAIATLRELDVAYCNITDRNVYTLSHCGELRVLVLSGNPVSNPVVDYLRVRCPRLEVLDLAYTDVSDGALVAMGQWTSLKRVDIGKTQITADGHRQLSAVLPHTEIHWTPR